MKSKTIPVGAPRDHFSITSDRLLWAKRPKTRGECVNGPRPCPWVGCRHHLYLDVEQRSGSLRIYHPDIEPHEMKVSCSLDEADEGPQDGVAIGLKMNVTRQRVDQMLKKLTEKHRVLKEFAAKFGELLRDLEVQELFITEQSVHLPVLQSRNIW